MILRATSLLGTLRAKGEIGLQSRVMDLEVLSFLVTAST